MKKVGSDLVSDDSSEEEKKDEEDEIRGIFDIELFKDGTWVANAKLIVVGGKYEGGFKISSSVKSTLDFDWKETNGMPFDDQDLSIVIEDLDCDKVKFSLPEHYTQFKKMQEESRP